MTDTDTTLAALTPDPHNARVHGERNLRLIAEALRDVGAARSIVVDEHGTVLAGNATVQAATQAGLSRVRIVEADGSELIAVQRSGLSPDQKTRLALYDNRAAELAGWDTDVLAALADEVDLSALWDADELADLLGQEVPSPPLLGDPDDVPDLPADPVTRPGDLWRLGNHCLLGGDSTDPDHVGRLMEGAVAACLWTDPPYGVSYVGKTADALTIANDTGAGHGGPSQPLPCQPAIIPHLQDGAAFYIAHPAGPLSQVFAQVLTGLGWRIRQTLVWVKDRFVLGHADYHYRHEPILFGYLPGPGRTGRGEQGWYGDHAQDTVFEIPRPTASPDHATGKPVALVAAMLTNSTKGKEVVLDPFGGSGTTLIACEQLGRSCRMLELDPRYCDVIVRRWEALTGRPAERVTGTGTG